MDFFLVNSKVYKLFCHFVPKPNHNQRGIIQLKLCHNFCSLWKIEMNLGSHTSRDFFLRFHFFQQFIATFLTEKKITTKPTSQRFPSFDNTKSLLFPQICFQHREHCLHSQQQGYGNCWKNQIFVVRRRKETFRKFLNTTSDKMKIVVKCETISFSY